MVYCHSLLSHTYSLLIQFTEVSIYVVYTFLVDFISPYINIITLCVYLPCTVVSLSMHSIIIDHTLHTATFVSISS